MPKKRAKRTRRNRPGRSSRALSNSAIIRPLPYPTRYFDNVFSLTNSTTTIGYSALSLVPQGFGQSQRTADVIRVKRMEVRMSLNLFNADVIARCRIGFFIWHQNTASVTPGPTSVLESSTTFGVESPYNYDGQSYYTILYDRIFNLIGTSSVPTPYSQYLVNRVFLLKNHIIRFNDGGGVTGSGHIYFFNLSDSSVSPHPAYTFTIRVWYEAF